MTTSVGTPAEARMGNDIARQFAHLPPADAAEAIARHLDAFWTPGMRRTLEALAAAHDGSLDPLLVDAARLLAARGPSWEPQAHGAHGSTPPTTRHPS